MGGIEGASIHFDRAAESSKTAIAIGRIAILQQT